MQITKKNQKRDRNPRQNISPLDHHAVSLRDAMNRLFDESFWDPFDNLSSLRHWEEFPKIDVSETDNEVKVQANIPGVDAEDIEIEVDENSLTISGSTEKEEKEENKDEKYYRYEREYGEFRREITLPAKINPDEVKAKTKKGVLKIALPKVEEEKKKRVKVEDEE